MKRHAVERKRSRDCASGSNVTIALRGESVIALVLAKQHLTAESAGADVLAVADDLLGLHATGTISPYLQLRARKRAFTPEELDQVLDAGEAARVGCMRRTLFVESAGLVPIVFAATRELTVRGRERDLAANGLSESRYQELAARVAEALVGRALDARELRDAIGAAERLSAVILVMCDEGRIVRWKGVRGWRSARPTYRRFDEAIPAVRLDSWDRQAAVRELVGRYVRRYGPVSESDITWWIGLSKTTIREALSSLPNLASVSIEGSPGAYLVDEDDIAEAQRLAAPPAESVSLLPVLDPYLQGYRSRQRCVEEQHHQFVFDGKGNTTSVILIAGRAAGVWDFIAEPSPELRLLFFDPLDADTRRHVRSVAADVAEFLADHSARVVEREHMRPLTQRPAGAVLSPLKDPG